MTRLEALERAAAIWGRHRIISVIPAGKAGFYVNLRPIGRPASDVRSRVYSAHSLDVNGHASCHADCKSLEP